MKKQFLAAVILGMVLIFGFSGCSKAKDDSSSDNGKKTAEEQKQQKKDSPPVTEEKKIELTEKEQYKINLFLSNFSEQRFPEYDSEDYDEFQLVDFAFTGARINDPDKVEYIEPDYAVSEKTINYRIKRYFGKTVTPEEGQKYEHLYEDEGFSECIEYKDGMFRMLAVDGESYGVMSVADEMVQQKDNKFKVSFKIYELPELNVGGCFIDDKNYYYTTPQQAEKSEEMNCIGSGEAIVVPYQNGKTDSYHLLKYTLD